MVVLEACFDLATAAVDAAIAVATTASKAAPALRTLDISFQAHRRHQKRGHGSESLATLPASASLHYALGGIPLSQAGIQLRSNVRMMKTIGQISLTICIAARAIAADELIVNIGTELLKLLPCKPSELVSCILSAKGIYTR